MSTARGLRRNALGGLLAACAIVACSAAGTEPKPTTRQPGRLIVSASVAGTPISTVVVEVTASDIPTPLMFNLTLTGTSASGTITVPAGSARRITIRAYDAAGIETHRGSKVLDVREGANNDAVTIAVLSLGGDQPITAQLSSHTVSVSPATATVSVSGPAVALTATVRDSDNNIVAPNGELHWATNAPAVATVSSGGAVTGVIPGTASVMATYRGVGASATVTVTP